MSRIVGGKVRPSLADYSISVKRRWLDELAMLIVRGDKDKVEISPAHYAHIHYWVVNNFSDDGYQLTHFTGNMLAYNLGVSLSTARRLLASIKKMMMLVEIPDSGVVFGNMDDGTPGRATYLHKLMFADMAGRPLPESINQVEQTTGENSNTTPGEAS